MRNKYYYKWTGIFQIFFIFLLLSTCTKKQKIVQSDLQKENLKGKVKTIISYEYSLTKKFGKLVPDELILIDTTKYNTKGQLEERIICLYSDVFIIGYEIEKSKYEFDKRGNRIIEIIENADEKSKSVYKYDKRNRLIKKIYDEINSLNNDCIVLFKYGKTGNLVEENSYTTSGDYVSSVKYEYDDDNFIVKMTKMKGPSSCDESVTYEYYNNGHFKEINKFSCSGSHKTNKEMFDKEGRIIEVQHFDATKNYILAKTDKYEYNENGTLHSFSSFVGPTILDTEDNKKNIFKYGRFDKRGNWLSQITYSFEIPSVLIKRKIYYSS